MLNVNLYRVWLAGREELDLNNCHNHSMVTDKRTALNLEKSLVSTEMLHVALHVCAVNSCVKVSIS